MKVNLFEIIVIWLIVKQKQIAAITKNNINGWSNLTFPIYKAFFFYLPICHPDLFWLLNAKLQNSAQLARLGTNASGFSIIALCVSLRRLGPPRSCHRSALSLSNAISWRASLIGASAAIIVGVVGGLRKEGSILRLCAIRVFELKPPTVVVSVVFFYWLIGCTWLRGHRNGSGNLASVPTGKCVCTEDGSRSAMLCQFGARVTKRHIWTVSSFARGSYIVAPITVGILGDLAEVEKEQSNPRESACLALFA